VFSVFSLLSSASSLNYNLRTGPRSDVSRYTHALDGYGCDDVDFFRAMHVGDFYFTVAYFSNCNTDPFDDTYFETPQYIEMFSKLVAYLGDRPLNRGYYAIERRLLPASDLVNFNVVEFAKGDYLPANCDDMKELDGTEDFHQVYCSLNYELIVNEIDARRK